MSKAFTKEPDNDAPEDETDVSDQLPAHIKNYMTPNGAKALQDELKQLQRVERPKVVEIVAWAAGNGDRSENGDYIYGKKRLREIDKRIRYINKRLESVEIVDPQKQQTLTQVFFGATVRYADEEGDEHTVMLVGIDEADIKQRKISWVSPLAKALMKAKAGDLVDVAAPGGTEQIKVLAVSYPIAAN